MKRLIDHRDDTGAILGEGEGDAAAFDAWTVAELDDDLGSLRSAFAHDDDVGG